MKSSASIAISLTLLMIILVLMAAFWFLFQGRQTIQGELTTSEETIRTLENQQAEMELNEQALQATLETGQNLYATAASDNVDLEGQLSESANSNATLEAISAEQALELEEANAAVETIESLGPIVSIVLPQEEQNIIASEPLQIVIVASDPKGIKEIIYNINTEVFSEEFDGEQSVTLRQSWTPPAPGTFTITASAINVQEISSQSNQSSLASNVTINVAEPATATPTPTETPEPTDTPTPTPES